MRMIMFKGHQQAPHATYTQRSSPFIDRSFQIRYGAIVVSAAAFGMALTILPITYYLNQNYDIFLGISYDQAPQLVEHLEREKLWVNSMLTAGLIGLLLFFGIVSYKLTNRIIGPLKVLQNHLKLLSRGYWYLEPIRVREYDEFQDLIEAYNYFFHSFKTNLQRDLKRLQVLSISPQNRDAHRAWKAMIDERVQQLSHVEQLEFKLSEVDESIARHLKPPKDLLATKSARHIRSA